MDNRPVNCEKFSQAAMFILVAAAAVIAVCTAEPMQKKSQLQLKGFWNKWSKQSDNISGFIVNNRNLQGFAKTGSLFIDKRKRPQCGQEMCKIETFTWFTADRNRTPYEKAVYPSPLAKDGITMQIRAWAAISGSWGNWRVSFGPGRSTRVSADLLDVTVIPSAGAESGKYKTLLDHALPQMALALQTALNEKDLKGSTWKNSCQPKDLFS